jgi:SAM-dependent methyltransferase
VSGSDPSSLWESIARDYERHAIASAYNALYDRPAVLDLCGDLRGARVLDLGCGPGLYASEFVARGAAHITGVDASPTMIDLARQRVSERADFRVHDLARPMDWVETESFDVAVMALVIHHLDDRISTLREIHRVLRPQGRLIVSTHHPTGDWLRKGGSYFDVSVIEETWSRGWNVRYWRLPLSESAAEFSQAGFLIEQLVEPQPTQELHDRFPDEYEKLAREPGFIAFALMKREREPGPA